jgi:hypothetical protein
MLGGSSIASGLSITSSYESLCAHLEPRSEKDSTVRTAVPSWVRSRGFYSLVGAVLTLGLLVMPSRRSAAAAGKGERSQRPSTGQVSAPARVRGAAVALSPTRYELDLDLDYESELLRASVTLEIENPATEAVRHVSLLLYRLMHVRTVRDAAGRKLDFKQEVVAFSDFRKLQINQVLVTLDRPLAPRERTAIRLEYDGYLLGYAETGMSYIQDRIDPDFTILRDDSFAFPRPGYPSVTSLRTAARWLFTYSARIAVPKGLVVANGGHLERTLEQGGKTTYVFASIKPSGRMDFAIARYQFLLAGPTRVYYLPGDDVGAAAVGQASEDAARVLGRWFGPLRERAALTFIEIPDGWGSQTDARTIIQSAGAFRDPKRLHEVYHEVSHLWNVESTDTPPPRLEEGLASFLEFLVTEEVTGEAVVDARANKVIEWLRAELPKHPEWRRVPLVDYGRADLTDVSYSVGALFFDLLYRIAGRDAFNKTIAAYLAHFGATGGGTNDLAREAQATASVDLSDLLHDWLYTPDWTGRIAQPIRVEDLANHYRRQ